MKHTSYFDAECTLLKIQKQEITEALKAHGCTYVFPDDDLGPYISSKDPKDETCYCIKKLTLLNNNDVLVTGVPEENPEGNVITLGIRDLAPLVIDYVLDSMAEAPDGKCIKVTSAPNGYVTAAVACAAIPLRQMMTEEDYVKMILEHAALYTENIEEALINPDDKELITKVVGVWMEKAVEKRLKAARKALREYQDEK